MKICPARAELFHADGQTDVMKLIDAFRNFAKAPRSVIIYRLYPHNAKCLRANG
jgi:hypothetical protein